MITNVRKKGLASEIQAFVGERGWPRIEEVAWDELRIRFASVSDSTLRKHLTAGGIDVAQPWRGLDTATLAGLEQTLVEMSDAYQTHSSRTRRAVIEAKDKTRFAARNPKVAADKRALKAEMVEWMLVWLGDPAMFADWVKLRKAYIESKTAADPLPGGSDGD